MKNRSGQLLIELVMVMGLAAAIVPALLTTFVTSREGRAQNKDRLVALAYLQEAKEAVRSVREADWATFAVNGTYHPVISGSTWTLTSGQETISGITRQIVLSDVQRDGSGVIVSSGGTVDPSTKQATLTVSWASPTSTSITSTLYLTRWNENAAYIETTEDEFNFVGNTHPGLKTGTNVQATNPPAVSGDGEVVLGAGGHSNWCTPALDATTLDLPKNGTANALFATESNAYATTGENASGVSFAKIDIGVSPPYPPTPTLASTFDGYKTNAIFGETNYAYIATDNNSKEVVIIDLNNIVSGKYQELGTFNAPGNSDGAGIYVFDNKGYVITGSTLYNFDLSSKSGSRSILDTNGVSLAGTGSSLAVSGNYAYVATGGSSAELQIVDISNSTNLTVVGQANVNSSTAMDIFINTSATRAYLAASQSASQSEMFIIDISTKTGNRSILGSYESNGMSPKSIGLVPGNRAIIGGSSGEEYQVIDISNEAAPVRCGGVDVPSGINDVSAVLESDNDAFTYILVGANPEFRIIEGGPGGGYSSSGTFESQTFNPGYQTANNRFTPTYTEPSGTDLQFQVSMANEVAGSCPTTGNYTFVGPDGTASTYYTQASGLSGTFPFTSNGNYANPGQCIRYKLFLTGDGSNSPIFSDITINYSP